MSSSDTPDWKARAQKELTDSLLAAQIHNKYCDLTIACGEFSWKVHRAVVCARSKFLDKVCEGGFKEEVTSIIDLKEDGPTAIWCMVQWFYSCDYTLDPTNSISFTNPTDDSLDLVNPLIVHLNVYIIADKYDLGLLKELAKLRFSGVLRAQIAGSIEWIQKDFPNIIRKVYDTTMASSDGLRERLMPMISEQWDLLRKEDAFMDLVRSVGDLTVDILDGWANDRCSLVNASVAGAPVVTYNCPSCRSNKAFDVSANGVNGICRTCRSRHRVAGWKKSEGWVY